MIRPSMVKKVIIILSAVFSFNMTLARNDSMSCPSILNITINWIELMPFLFFSLEYNNKTGLAAGYLPYYMQRASNKCGCPMMSFNYQRMNISSSEEMEIKIRSSLRTTTPELYFPIFANRKESTQFQRPFLALFQSPGPAVVEVEVGSWSENVASINMVMQTWPILSVCLLFGILAGFIVWAIEHRKNSEEFPAKFPHGALVGIWWSFVTMTTVGYGDKTTRTFWGRMFAVFWMVLGTIVMSMFTGQITANITSSEIATVDLMDTKVAVPMGMKSFLGQEFNLGAQYSDMTYSDMQKLLMTPKDELKYFLIHDNEMARKWMVNETNGKLKIAKNIDKQFMIGLTVTGDFKHIQVFFSCLQEEIIDIYQIEQAKDKLAVKSSEPESESGPNTQVWFIISTATIFAVFSLLGFLWEWRRRRMMSRLSSDVEDFRRTRKVIEVQPARGQHPWETTHH
ncbi:uncharacterized protein LOC116290828 [Actinia tenebrosa]|uniref:Uncharacterized protein LOC116290828 n=1 Tax=Actinia tenebrosa TaxID=6105 RepID=A0A6P8HDN4_ACTTE|nr:uncharacterized protein LOC116290828 [Actinia tenebrosa]